MELVIGVVNPANQRAIVVPARFVGGEKGHRTKRVDFFPPGGFL
jgi:hypothetical protein